MYVYRNGLNKHVLASYDCESYLQLICTFFQFSNVILSRTCVSEHIRYAGIELVQRGVLKSFCSSEDNQLIVIHEKEQ